METMGIIFSNIFDAKMGELTNDRAAASIPFASRYRQIDFILSDMSNSGIRNVGIITKLNYGSLMDHLGSCDEWDMKLGDNVRFLPPYSTGHLGAYHGKLEALQSAMAVLTRSSEEYVILADTSVLCNINFREVMEAHVSSGCDMTVIATPGRADGKREYSLTVKLDKDGKIEDMAADYAAPADYLVGMSMFIMRREKLIEVIKERNSHGKVFFEKDFLMPEYASGHMSVNVYTFHGVTLFNENVDDYFANNMKLLDADVRKSLFKDGQPIYTKVRDAVPTLVGEIGVAANCLVADGCHVFGTAENSVLFREVHIDEGAVVQDSIVMQGCKIGPGAKIRYCILDKNVTIRPGTQLLGSIDHPLVVDKGDSV